VSCQMCIFPAEVEQRNTLPSCFSSHTVNEYSLQFSVIFSTFLCFLISNSGVLKWLPKCSAKVLSSVPKAQEECDVPYGE